MNISEEQYHEFQARMAARKVGKAVAAKYISLTRPTQPPVKKSREMNKTEARFFATYIHPYTSSKWRFEGIKFNLANRNTYTPDFIVWDKGNKPIIFEVKGAHVYEDSKIKFQMTKEIFGGIFDFEAWQWKNQEWRRLDW